MPMDDLYKALQMFKQGVNEYQTSSAISQANEAVQQAKANISNEHEQRSALQSISNGLVARMAGLGVPATTIQQVAGALGPKQYGSIGEMKMDAQLSNNGQLAVDASALQEDALAPGIAAEDRQFKRGVALQNLKFQQALELAKLKGSQKGAGSQKTNQADVEFSTNVQAALLGARKLKNIVNQFGNAENVNPKAKAILNQAAYDLSIAYAKIVDPATAAREGEVAAAQKYMIPMGWDTRNSVTLASVDEYVKKIKTRMKARAQAKAKGVMDPFDQHFGGQPTAPVAPAPTEESPDDLSSFIMGD